MVPDRNWGQIGTLIGERVSDPARMALMAEDLLDGCGDLLEKIRTLGALADEALPIPLVGESGAFWAYSHRDALMEGVSPPGIWGAGLTGLLPKVAINGLVGVAGACTTAVQHHSRPGAPRMGATLAVVELGSLELLVCTLPLIEGLAENVPVAWRLLANILAWLRGGNPDPLSGGAENDRGG